jgi:hypothetical protein
MVNLWVCSHRSCTRSANWGPLCVGTPVPTSVWAGVGCQHYSSSWNPPWIEQPALQWTAHIGPADSCASKGVCCRCVNKSVLYRSLLGDAFFSVTNHAGRETPEQQKYDPPYAFHTPQLAEGSRVLHSLSWQLHACISVLTAHSMHTCLSVLL